MKDWDPKFGPSYTPMQMLDLGIFEGIYTSAIPDIPAKYKNHPKVLKRGSEPDVNINHYKIKSRQSLKEWQKKKWVTKHSPLGWWQWYINYFEGRRIPEEDQLQINRWRSFVARHSAQVIKNCSKGDKSCRPKQKQGLLQWAWNADQPFNEEQIKKNQKKLGVQLTEPSTEDYIPSLKW